MKKILLLVSFTLVIMVDAQQKTYQEMVSSRDIPAIEAYIQENPNDLNSKKLKYLLIKLKREEREKINREKKAYSVKDFRAKIAQQRASFKHQKEDEENFDSYVDDTGTESGANSNRRVKRAAISVSRKTFKYTTAASSLSKKEETELLNHLFSSSKNKTKAYLQIKNSSNCKVNLAIIGPKKYSISILGRGEGHILVNKGTYEFTTTICTTNYYRKRMVNGDVEIVLKP